MFQNVLDDANPNHREASQAFVRFFAQAGAATASRFKKLAVGGNFWTSPKLDWIRDVLSAEH